MYAKPNKKLCIHPPPIMEQFCSDPSGAVHCLPSSAWHHILLDLQHMHHCMLGTHIWIMHHPPSSYHGRHKVLALISCTARPLIRFMHRPFVHAFSHKVCCTRAATLWCCVSHPVVLTHKHMRGLEWAAFKTHRINNCTDETYAPCSPQYRAFLVCKQEMASFEVSSCFVTGDAAGMDGCLRLLMC